VFTPDEVVLANSLTHAFGQFAYSVNPNANWPAYDPKVDAIYQFRTPSNMRTTNYRELFCDLWDRVGYVPGNI